MENILLYVTIGSVLALAFIKNHFDTLKYELDREYLLFMWLIHVSTLDDLEQDTGVDKSALFNYLSHRNIKIPDSIAKDTNASRWLPEKYVSNKKGIMKR